jgi:hypothetical protein
MRSQRPRQSRTRPLNELTAALWPAFIPLRKSQGPFKSRPNCPAVYPEGVQVGPGVLLGGICVRRGTRKGDRVVPVPTRCNVSTPWYPARSHPDEPGPVRVPPVPPWKRDDRELIVLSASQQAGGSRIDGRDIGGLRWNRSAAVLFGGSPPTFNAIRRPPATPVRLVSVGDRRGRSGRSRATSPSLDLGVRSLLLGVWSRRVVVHF